MLEQVQSWRGYEDIVRFEARRMGPVYGLDREDVEQELRLVAVHCADLVQDNTGRSYVRKALRNRLANMQREANAGSRRPRDGRGRLVRLAPVEYVNPDGEIVERPLPALGSLPDERAEALRMMRRLRGLSTKDQRILYRAFVDCVRVDDVALERARKRAEAILTRAVGGVERYPKETTMGSKAKKVEAPTEELPLCHTRGTEPVGYETDPKEDATECRDCLHKASCLIEGLGSGLIKGADLSIDQEVKAVRHGLISTEQMRNRIELRESLRANQEEVPADAQHDDVGGLQEKLDTLPDRVDVAGPGEDEPEPAEASGSFLSSSSASFDRAAAKIAKKSQAVVAPKAAKAPKAKKASKAKLTKVEPVGEMTQEQVEEAVAKLKAKTAKAPGPSAPARSKAPKSVPTAAKAKAKRKAAPKKATKAKPAKKFKPHVKAEKGKQGPQNRLGEKGSFRYPGKPRDLKDGGIQLPNGHKVAPPRDLTPEQMGIVLEKTNQRLGLPFDLVPGMSLVQERRDGPSFEVKVTAKGFEWGGNAYPSLSGAVMARLRRVCSGMDLFDFTKNNNIFVKGKGVPGGMFRRSSVEGQAAAE